MASVLQQYRRRASQLPDGPYAIENIAHSHFRVVKIANEHPVVVLNAARLVEVGQWLRDQCQPVTPHHSQ
jgi:hypothetical protein